MDDRSALVVMTCHGMRFVPHRKLFVPMTVAAIELKPACNEKVQMDLER